MLLLVQLMAPVVLGSGPSGQHRHLASSAPGQRVFSHEDLKNVNSPESTGVPGSLAEMGSSWLCRGVFLQTPRRAAGPISFIFHVAGRGLFYFLSASNQDFIFPWLICICGVNPMEIGISLFVRLTQQSLMYQATCYLFLYFYGFRGFNKRAVFR